MTILVLKTAAHFAEQMTTDPREQEEMAARYGGEVCDKYCHPDHRVIQFLNPDGYRVHCEPGKWFIKHPDTRYVIVMTTAEMKNAFKKI